MKDFDSEWSIFSEQTGNFNREQQWCDRQPRHISMPPGQRCQAKRNGLAAPFAERLRRERVRAQLAQQLGSDPTPVLVG